MGMAHFEDSDERRSPRSVFRLERRMRPR